MDVPREIAIHHARMVMEAMIRGEPTKAHAAVDRAFEVAKQELEKVTSKTHVAEILSVRVANSLEAAGIFTVGDLSRQTREQLAHIYQLKWKSIDVIERQLGRHGFRLKS